MQQAIIILKLERPNFPVLITVNGFTNKGQKSKIERIDWKTRNADLNRERFGGLDQKIIL